MRHIISQQSHRSGIVSAATAYSHTFAAQLLSWLSVSPHATGLVADSHTQARIAAVATHHAVGNCPFVRQQTYHCRHYPIPWFSMSLRRAMYGLHVVFAQFSKYPMFTLLTSRLDLLVPELVTVCHMPTYIDLCVQLLGGGPLCGIVSLESLAFLPD